MTRALFDFLEFHQYGQGGSEDLLLMFAAPAKKIAAWAGIPRKGWQIRMLFQRPITPNRERELKEFWEIASSPQDSINEKFILGPTAIIAAIQGEPKIENGKLDISYQPVVDVTQEPVRNIKLLAERLLPKIRTRLTDIQRDLLNEFTQTPFSNIPEIGHDYVFEFALQLTQMKEDAEKFLDINGINEASKDEIVRAMESICRPAILVDGQHRLWGAAHNSKDIILPVIAIPHCDWMEQIYQFVVINEKAQKVETSLLTDIFGSSLTKQEQARARKKLERSKVDVESRIAAVIASRESESPFFNMVQLKIEGTPPADYNPYLTERTIRALIDGTSQKYSRGWRTDDDFYDEYVKPKFPDRADWESWTSGRWRDYWLCFWLTIREFYNDQSQKLPSPFDIWNPTSQSNLTKAVTLRLLQTLFMEQCIERMRNISKVEEVLRETLGDEAAEEKLEQQRKSRSIPVDLDDFKDFVISSFLERGIPLKVFVSGWKKSLDDVQGQMDLWDTLVTAFERTSRGERFVCRGRIFEAADES